MNAPTGITYQNVPNTPAGQVNPLRTQLFGRLGSTPSHTLLLHPEMYKTLGPKNIQVAKSLSLQDARKEPGTGTAEGVRYWQTLRKELGGAHLKFNPTTGQWKTRTQMRPVNYEEGASYLINRAMSKLRMGGPEFTGYSPDTAWQTRLKSGIAQESKTEKDVGSTIETYEGGKQPLGGRPAQQLMSA